MAAQAARPVADAGRMAAKNITPQTAPIMARALAVAGLMQPKIGRAAIRALCLCGFPKTSSGQLERLISITGLI